MSRYIFSLLTFFALAIPVQAQCGFSGRTCSCSSSPFSVYPEVTASRRLAGQWWNDHTPYPVSPPANHAYGYVDNSHKPWSLIPGDGYVGSSPDKTPEESEDEEAGAKAEPLPEPTPDDATEEGLGFGASSEAKPAGDDAKEEKKDSDDAEGEATSPDEPSEPSQMKSDERERRDTPRRRRRPFRRPEENEEQGAIFAPGDNEEASLPLDTPTATEDEFDFVPPSPANSVSMPADGDQAAVQPPTQKAGLPLSLFGAAMLTLMFSGHFARQACQTPRNEDPLTRI